MRLSRISVCNYRSIRNCDCARIEPLQAFVGENNAGKSNLLRAIRAFLSSGAGGVIATDFNDSSAPITIDVEFAGLDESERRRLRQYLLGDRLMLQKKLTIQDDPRSGGKQKVVSEYHGYSAEPSDWRLSIRKIEEREGARPNWKKIAEAAGILAYVALDDQRVTKASFVSGLARYLMDHPEVEYEQPELGQTQALGIQTNLLSALPEFYLLPAITDYSDEIDRRSSSSVFRQLMGNLSDRIVKGDSRYAEIEAALTTLRRLLNPSAQCEQQLRLQTLADAEVGLAHLISKLMPSVTGVQLEVEIEETKELFTRGVSLRVDDGVLTNVLDKGHGLQRSVVFGLLQMLIQTARQQSSGAEPAGSIILGIEEPELYIHPQSQRLIYNVLREFAGVSQNPPSGSDQVIYTTHSPAFIDVASYERIAIVRKPDLATGTSVKQCDLGALGSPAERAGFKLLTSFGLKHNEVFFARRAILVEGAEDEIAIIAAARKLGRIAELPDEIGLAIVVTSNKEQIPKFQRVLNAFDMEYGVLLELDGKPETEQKNAQILSLLNGNRVAKFPTKLETAVGLDAHFRDVFHAKSFFSDPANITSELESVAATLVE